MFKHTKRRKGRRKHPNRASKRPKHTKRRKRRQRHKKRAPKRTKRRKRKKKRKYRNMRGGVIENMTGESYTLDDMRDKINEIIRILNEMLSRRVCA